ncbi:MAG: metallopeptidase TldD-related protein, partial [Actinomycetota bacterium]|nr:metallopeptidase TldD-related protein [Actinomycetota bacterium]
MPGPSPQELVERALECSRSDHCIAVARTSTSANLRWANNTLTTNGVMHGLEVSVIAFRGLANASVSGTAASIEQVSELVQAADLAAEQADPAEDLAELVTASASADWDQPPGDTSIEVYEGFARDLGEAFESSEKQARVLYGFINHEVTTTYLGSSTGLRLRHEQPTGHYACTGKTADLTNSAWVGGATRDFADVDANQMAETLAARLAWGRRRLDLPAGRYDTVLPPTAVADLMVDAYWSAGARLAFEGQSVYSRPQGGTRIGERIVKPGVALFSDPSYAGLQAAPFVVDTSSSNTSSVYDNGLPLSRTDWVKGGTLTALIQTRHTAAMTEQPVTPGVDNLVLDIDGASGSEMDLVGSVD